MDVMANPNRGPSIAAVAFGLTAGATCVWLLTAGHIGETAFVTLTLAIIVAVLGIAGFARLKEFSLRDLKLTLGEIREVKQQVAEAKAELAEMYGGIENLRREPFVLDDAKRKDLGHRDGVAMSSGAMRYTAGCIKRERERLARVFVNVKTPEQLARAILDNSMDELVFKWNGPEALLDDLPKSVEQRAAEKAPSEPATASGGELPGK